MPSRTVLLCIGWSSAALAVQLTLAHLVGICGFECGTKFSPDTFQVREYRTYRWGAVEFPRSETLGGDALRRYLVANGHIEADPPNVRWVHVDAYRPRWISLGCRIYGPPLSRALDELQSPERDLLEWSKREPALAKAFWSRVVEWMRAGKYEEVELFLRYFYEGSQSVAHLEEQLDNAERLVASGDF